MLLSSYLSTPVSLLKYYCYPTALLLHLRSTLVHFFMMHTVCGAQALTILLCQIYSMFPGISYSHGWTALLSWVGCLAVQGDSRHVEIWVSFSSTSSRKVETRLTYEFLWTVLQEVCFQLIYINCRTLDGIRP